VALAPGQTVPVSILLGPRAFSIWNSTHQAWVSVPGGYRVMVGDSSAHLPLTAAVSIG
jgi:beta-glucosidase